MLDLAKQQAEKGKSVEALCHNLQIPLATYYRWKESGATPREPEGRPGLDMAIVAAMKEDVKLLHHATHRTRGVKAIYEEYGKVVPRRVIQKAIAEARHEAVLKRKESAMRYEFLYVQAAYSVDYIQVRPEGRIMRIQDDTARCALGITWRSCWEDEDSARFLDEAIARYGAPLFLKSDLGSEFRGDAFQEMLRRHRIIPLPNPPWRPPYNGKHERMNRDVRQWLLPFAEDLPTREEVFRDVGAALLDHNQVRTREAYGYRKPQELFLNGPRANVPREALYARWEALKDRILAPRKGGGGIICEPRDVWEAYRIAAVVVLKEWKLVRYFQAGERPEVLPQLRPENSH